MNLKFALLTGVLLSSSTMFATPVTISLGQSNQPYTLVGTGGSIGYGTYLAQQGDCVSGATITTCTLSGLFSGATSGFSSGTYALTTTYDNGDGGLPATSTSPVIPPNGGNYFSLDQPFAPDVLISLYLNDISGGKTVLLADNGMFLADSWLITSVDSTCSNLPAGVTCTQGNVGLSDGASISSPVTGQLTFDTSDATNVTPSPVPEPGWLALGGLLPGAFLMLRRHFARNV